MGKSRSSSPVHLDTVLGAACPLGVVAFVVAGIVQRSLAFAGVVGLAVTLGWFALVLIVCAAIDFGRGFLRGARTQRELRELEVRR